MDYYYRKNIQGDVIAIHNANGTLVASYAYDAWGTSTVAAGMSITFLQMFAIGALIYNTAAILLSIFGVEAPMIECESQDPVSYPKMKK